MVSPHPPPKRRRNRQFGGSCISALIIFVPSPASVDFIAAGAFPKIWILCVLPLNQLVGVTYSEYYSNPWCIFKSLYD